MLLFKLLYILLKCRYFYNVNILFKFQTEYKNEIKNKILLNRMYVVALK